MQPLARAYFFTDEIQLNTASFEVRDISQMRSESGTVTYQNVTIGPLAALDAIEEVADMVARHPVSLVTLLLYR